MAGPKRQVVDGKLKCSKCSEWKVFDEYYPSKYTSTGKTSQCRACCGSHRAVGVCGRVPIEPVDGQFQCQDCGEWKPLDQFEKNKACWHGYARRCRDCSSQKYKEFVSQSPFNFLRNSARSLTNSARQRSKRSADSFSKEMLVPAKLLALYEAQGGKCVVSGVELTFDYTERRQWTNISIDRIDPSKGYEQGNVRLVCLAVNIMRNDMPDDDFFAWMEKIAAFRKQIK